MDLFQSALEIFSVEIIGKFFFPSYTNSFASNQLILIFLNYLEVSENRKKSKRNKYMAADVHTDNFQGLASFLDI